MSQLPLVSILIASYNNGRYIKETLDSIYKQNYANWEIIIVDDFSTDDSQTIYNSLKDDSRIKIFYNDKNYGCGYTKAKCAELASGELCGFVDPDDALREDALKKMVDLHIQNKEYSLIHSKRYNCDENLNIQSEFIHSKDVLTNQPMFFNLNGEISHFVVFKKDFYNQTAGIDKSLLRAVDQDLYLKLYDVGKTLYLDEPLYYYRFHKGGISTNTNSRKAFYWHWLVIMDTVKRRNLNFEDEFFKYFTPTFEYDHIYNEYNKLKSNIFVRILRKLRLI